MSAHELRIGYFHRHTGWQFEAYCTGCASWHRVTSKPNGAPEPLELTSFAHWCHQLDVLAAQKRVCEAVGRTHEPDALRHYAYTDGTLRRIEDVELP